MPDLPSISALPAVPSVHAPSFDGLSPMIQPGADWKAGWLVPYGVGITGNEIANLATKYGVGIERTPFPSSDLYLPGRGEPIKGAVMVLHGSEAPGYGSQAFESALWASRGYVALAYAYSGVPGRPQQLANVSVDDAIHAARWLQTLPQNGGSPIGLLGVSRGAELAALIASAVPTGLVGAVVTRSGPQAEAAGSFGISRRGTYTQPMNADGSDAPAWTLGGKPVVEGAPIAAEKSDAPFFIEEGLQDQVWPSHGVQQFADRLVAAGKHPVTVWLPDQGHVPDTSATARLFDQIDDFLTGHLRHTSQAPS